MSQRKAEKEYFMKLGRLYSCEGRNFGLSFSVVDGNKGSGTWLTLSSTQIFRQQIPSNYVHINECNSETQFSQLLYR
jgi:hypothetical protein